MWMMLRQWPLMFLTTLQHRQQLRPCLPKGDTSDGPGRAIANTMEQLWSSCARCCFCWRYWAWPHGTPNACQLRLESGQPRDESASLVNSAERGGAEALLG